MPIAYDTPRWVGTPADPAAHYATGVQIGMRLGAQQAAQMFQQQQLELQRQHQLMAAQQQEVENQYNTQVLNLKASEMARRHQANQEFRVRVSRGEDPSNVLMQLAPDMGESATGVLTAQARQSSARELAGYREAQLRRAAAADAERERIANAQIASRERIASTRDTFASKVDKLASLTEAFNAAQASGDPETIARAKAELDAARAFVPTSRMPPEESELIVKDLPGIGKAVYARGSKQIHIMRPEANRMTFKAKNLPLMLRDGRTLEDADKILNQAWDKLAPDASATGTAGDNTLPDRAIATPPTKVKVRNPQGKIGLVPADQLNAALAQGYTKVD